MNESEKVESLSEAGKPADSPAAEDTDFEPTADMMIHEYDDETTLNEEEDDIDTNEDELADLEKEGEMPLEELYALYYGGGNPYNANNEENGEGANESSDDQTSGDAPKRNLRSMSTLVNPLSLSGSESSDEESNMLRVDERKKPRIGDQFQASTIPELVKKEQSQCSEDDKQVWSPWKLPEDSTIEYLKEVAVFLTTLSQADADSAAVIQDNEDALFLLAQCDYNIEEALRRFKSRPPPLSSEIQVWSVEECNQFEEGLVLYGKEFYLIHINVLKTRSVRDIVKFYYIWKKSERYDQFTAKTRFGKKKETLPANITDYMDRLLDETDSACTSAFLNYNGGNNLRYPTMAHSAALMEHLRQLEAVVSAESGENVQHSSIPSQTAPLSSRLELPTQVNNSNNKESELTLSESDFSQVIDDLTQSSSGFG